MRLHPAILCLALAGLPLSQDQSQALAQAEPGDLWEVTTEMQGAGMTMPGMTQKVCAPRGAEGPEALGGGDNRCQMSDIQRSPGRFSYRVQCPDGSGTGEMVYNGRDSYQSTMTMTTQGETMTMKSRGRRVGDCDASVQKKQLAALQAQAAEGMAQSCAAAVEQLNPMMLDPKMGLNCEARYKQQLCARLETAEGFDLAASRQGTEVPAGMMIGNLAEVAAFCGANAEAVRAMLCQSAEAGEKLDFIGRHCPAIAQPIAQRECAGRNFTTPRAEKYREFCYSYAREMMQGGDDAQPGAPSPQDLLKKGTQRLKGLFGR